jgi:hypothetical protein
MEELIRLQMHEALDFERPSHDLRYRVVGAALADHRSRTRIVYRQPRFDPLVQGLRGAGAAVAMVLVLLLVGTTLTGGRLLREWDAFTRPATTAPTIDPQQLAELEARPLKLQPLANAEACTLGPASPYEGFGSGRVSGLGVGTWSTTRWGVYFPALLSTDSQLRGLVLIRGRDLEDDGLVVFVGRYATGPVVGSDQVNGKSMVQHSELALDPTHPPKPAPPISAYINQATSTTYTSWEITYGLKVLDSRSRCIGWQVDGLDFPWRRS